MEDYDIDVAETAMVAYIVNGKPFTMAAFLELVRSSTEEIKHYERSEEWAARREVMKDLVVVPTSKTYLNFGKVARALEALESEFPGVFHLLPEAEYVSYDWGLRESKSILMLNVETNRLVSVALTIPKIPGSIQSLAANPGSALVYPEYRPSYEIRKHDRSVVTIALNVRSISHVDESMMSDVYTRFADCLASNFFGASGFEGQIGRLRSVLEVYQHASVLPSLAPLGSPGVNVVQALSTADVEFFKGLPHSQTPAGRESMVATAIDNLYGAGGCMTRAMYVSLHHPYLFRSSQLMLINQMYHKGISLDVLRSMLPKGRKTLEDMLLNAFPQAFERDPDERSKTDPSSYSDEDLASEISGRLAPFLVSLIVFKESSTAGSLIIGKHSEVKYEEAVAACKLIDFFHSKEISMMSNADIRSFINGLSLAKVVPKTEVYPTVKKGIKERNIFATNTFFYLPLQMFLRSYLHNLELSLGPWYKRSGDLVLLYPFKMTDSSLERLAVRDSNLPVLLGQPCSQWHADIYSDNLYLSRRWVDVDAYTAYAGRGDFESHGSFLDKSKDIIMARGPIAGVGIVERVSLDGSSMEASTNRLAATMAALGLIEMMYPKAMPEDFQAEVILATVNGSNDMDVHRVYSAFSSTSPNPGISAGWIRYIIMSFQASATTVAILGKTQFYNPGLASGTANTFIMNSIRMTILADHLLEYLHNSDIVGEPIFPYACPPLGVMKPEDYHGAEHKDDISVNYLRRSNDGTTPLLHHSRFDYERAHRFHSISKVAPGQPPAGPFKSRYRPVDFFSPRASTKAKDAISKFSIIRGVVLRTELYSPPWSQPTYADSPMVSSTGIKKLDLLGFDAMVTHVNSVPFTIPVLDRDRLDKMLLWTKAAVTIKGSASLEKDIQLRIARLSKNRSAYLYGAWADVEYRVVVKQLLDIETAFLSRAIGSSAFVDYYESVREQIAAAELNELMDSEELQKLITLDSLESVISQPQPSLVRIAQIFLSKDSLNLFASLLKHDFSVICQKVPEFFNDGEDAVRTLLWGQHVTFQEVETPQNVLLNTRLRLKAIGLNSQVFNTYGALGVFPSLSGADLEETFAERCTDEEYKDAAPRIRTAINLLRTVKVKYKLPAPFYSALKDTGFQVRFLKRKAIYHLYRIALTRVAKVSMPSVRRFFSTKGNEALRKELPILACNVNYEFKHPFGGDEIIGTNTDKITNSAQLFANTASRTRKKNFSGKKKGSRMIDGMRAFQTHMAWEEEDMEAIVESNLQRQEMREAILDEKYSNDVLKMTYGALKRAGIEDEDSY